MEKQQPQIRQCLSLFLKAIKYPLSLRFLAHELQVFHPQASRGFQSRHRGTQGLPNRSSRRQSSQEKVEAVSYVNQKSWQLEKEAVKV